MGETVTEKLEAGWWIATDRLDRGGRAVLGPFGSRDLALRVRGYVEGFHGNRGALWVQEVDETGRGLW